MTSTSYPFPIDSPYYERMKADHLANMTSSRGCYSSCGFCSVNAFYRLGDGPGWRPRSAVNVVDEMEHLVRSGARYVHFVDDNFMGPGERGRKRARQVGDEILRRRLEVRFNLDCRPNDVDRETLAFLRDAGLKRVGIGAESMLLRQLKLYRKGVSVEQNLRAIDTLEALGLEYHVFFVPIEPYVTIEELLEDMAMMERIGLAHIVDGQILAWLVVLEGTPILDDVRRDGLLYAAPPGAIDLEFTWGYPYVFRDRRVGRMLPHLHTLYFEYLDLGESLSELSAAANPLVQHFHHEVLEELKRHKFASIRTLLQAAQVGEAAETAAALLARAQRLGPDLARIASAYASGAFDRFRPIQLPLGDATLDYPPPHVTRLADAMYERIACAARD